MNWVEANLKDLVDIKTGKKDANEGDENGSYRFYTCAKDYSFIKDYAFDEEAILISGNGAYVGYVHYYNGKFDAYQRTYILSDFKVNVFFLFHYLGENLRLRIHREKQDGATPYIKKGTLAKFKIEYPENPAEQTAIATLLSKVDEAIAATQNSIKVAEKLKKALMQNLLTGKLKPDGTWRSEDEFYEDEKFGKVPKGWEVKKLKDVCICGGQYGANASAVDFVEGKPRYIRITDIDDFGNLIEENKAGIEKDKVKDYLLKDNDFLFARTGDTVGKSLLYKEEMGLSAYAGYLIKFTFNADLILPEYFNLVAKSDIFEAFKVAMQRVGAKPNINSREYGSFKFPLSNDINEQQLIFEQAKPINESISRKQTKIQTLQRLKKSLMQNLLTGKVRLPQEFIAQFEEVEETIKS
ncbi:MAG: restriction endonuclease subunit S [Flavobacteriales bacterium]|nr:restriction endonuclease subunit S [Flavobacteriales bacterium]